MTFYQNNKSFMYILVIGILQFETDVRYPIEFSLNYWLKYLFENALMDS